MVGAVLIIWKELLGAVASQSAHGENKKREDIHDELKK